MPARTSAWLKSIDDLLALDDDALLAASAFKRFLQIYKRERVTQGEGLIFKQLAEGRQIDVDPSILGASPFDIEADGQGNWYVALDGLYNNTLPTAASDHTIPTSGDLFIYIRPRYTWNVIEGFSYGFTFQDIDYYASATEITGGLEHKASGAHFYILVAKFTDGVKVSQVLFNNLSGQDILDDGAEAGQASLNPTAL